MAFNPGDQVEVCSKDGFGCSYYTATVVSQIFTRCYVVQYKKLVEKDESTPLTETVSADKLRPIPPKTVSAFVYQDKVDAFDNAGWWVGKIIGKKGSNYKVYFDQTRDKIAYPVSQLRLHQDCINGKWITSKKSGLLP